ncbi:hypothetical protein KY317_00420 [Candidatus Woesearchaeota archaeon]|nr:hypothetical protein [Candidatus Woesearchaeota archaeon]
MLKNHLNKISYATSMPLFYDGWFLTGGKKLKLILKIICYALFLMWIFPRLFLIFIVPLAVISGFFTGDFAISSKGLFLTALGIWFCPLTFLIGFSFSGIMLDILSWAGAAYVANRSSVKGKEVI